MQNEKRFNTSPLCQRKRSTEMKCLIKNIPVLTILTFMRTVKALTITHSFGCFCKLCCFLSFLVNYQTKTKNLHVSQCHTIVQFNANQSVVELSWFSILIWISFSLQNTINITRSITGIVDISKIPFYILNILCCVFLHLFWTVIF